MRGRIIWLYNDPTGSKC